METVPPAANLDTIHSAYHIAVRDLRACYNPDGIVAGRLHFNAYWARDGFWAAFGALALGDADQAKIHLDMFIDHQLSSGNVPVRIEFVGHTLGGYHTLRASPKALFRAGTIFVDPLDPAALFIIAGREYFQRTGDMDFCSRFEPAMDRAIAWLMRHDRDADALLESRYLADWMDSILKKDKVFNINVIYHEGLRACASLKETLGKPHDAEKFREVAARTAEQLQAQFWNGDYFTDWIRGSQRGGFSADGNILAIFFNVATEAQARQILAYITAHGLDRETPLRTCYPIYPPWHVFPLYYLAGLGDYHRALIWPWLGTLNAVNKFRLGLRDAALADLARIGQWYIHGHAVNEVYSKEGIPVVRRFYHAEVPFAWNAGLYVYASHTLRLISHPPG